MILPNLQHPEVALLASATPSPMTPSEDKVPRVDLDKVNNNYISHLRNEDKYIGNRKKCHIKESKLPIPSKVILSPTSTPRKPDHSKIDPASRHGTTQATRGRLPRNLTRTVTSVTSRPGSSRSSLVCQQLNAELIQCRVCGKVQCIKPDHNHMPRTKAKTLK